MGFLRNSFFLDSEVLTDEVWTHLSITYEDVNGSLSIYADGLLLGQVPGTTLPEPRYHPVFTLTLGGGSLPIDALFDDLRIYSDYDSFGNFYDLW